MSVDVLFVFWADGMSRSILKRFLRKVFETRPR